MFPTFYDDRDNKTVLLDTSLNDFDLQLRSEVYEKEETSALIFSKTSQ